MDYYKNIKLVKGIQAIKSSPLQRYLWNESILIAKEEITIPVRKSIFPKGLCKLTSDNSCDICCASSLMGT